MTCEYNSNIIHIMVLQMSKSRIARKEQSRQREDRILLAARTLAVQHGYLALKVSDVAAEAEVSIGTFYSHFESKEDLIVGLAIEAFCKRSACIDAILCKEKLKLSERLLSAVFADFLFSVDHPELFEAEQLAATTSVWQSASDHRTQAMLSPHREIMDRLSSVALRAIENGEFEAWHDPQDQARSIDRGIWSLMAGNSYVFNAIQHLEDDAETARALPDWFKNNCCSMFRGYGWVSKDHKADTDRLAKYCIRYGRFR